jgi:hypothetical protein
MRRVFMVSALVLSIAGLAVAPAQAAQRPISGTLNGTISGIGISCCSTFESFEGRAVVQGIGRVVFTGEHQFVCGRESPCFRDVVVTLESARSGWRRTHGTLRLHARTEVPPQQPEPPLVWTADEGTGRFARWGGVGTFRVLVDDFPETGGRLVLSLAGVLTEP